MLVKVRTRGNKLRVWRWWLYRSRQNLASPYSLKATILAKLKFYLRKILEIYLRSQGLLGVQLKSVPPRTLAEHVVSLEREIWYCIPSLWLSEALSFPVSLLSLLVQGVI